MTKKAWIVVGIVVLALVVCWRGIAGDFGHRPVIMLVPTAAAPPIVVPGDTAVPPETAALLRQAAARSDVILWGD